MCLTTPMYSNGTVDTTRREVSGHGHGLINGSISPTLSSWPVRGTRRAYPAIGAPPVIGPTEHTTRTHTRPDKLNIYDL